MAARTGRVIVATHPLVRDRLGPLRDRATPPPLFRRLVHELAQFLFWESTADLELEEYRVQTPLAECTAERLKGRIGLVPILRAGLGMAQAILDLVPEAAVWHLGVYRDHHTALPITYYNKLSESHGADICYMLDPMLATGGSAIEAISILKKAGVPRIKFLGLIAAPEGVESMHAAHPDVDIHLAALDRQLNAQKYIVPGLGDAGDRQFATF